MVFRLTLERSEDLSFSVCWLIYGAGEELFHLVFDFCNQSLSGSIRLQPHKNKIFGFVFLQGQFPVSKSQKNFPFHVDIDSKVVKLP